MLRQAIIETNGDSLLNRLIVFSSELSQEPLQVSHRNHPYETSTDIKDSKFVDHLYIDWHVAKQPYASNAEVLTLPYQD